MRQSSAERLAYLQGAATRADLVPLVRGVTSLLTATINIAISLTELHEDAEHREKAVPPVDAYRAIIAELGSMEADRNALLGTIRELENGGIDPEWDHKS